MQRKSVAHFISAFVFLSILALCIWLLAQVLLIKRIDGITPMQDLYAQRRNTVDALFCGSSLSGLNIDQECLWSEYGIAGYSLWGSVQPFWNSYYFLKEALKYQKPKVVILEVSAAENWAEYNDDARKLMNTQGMRLSANYIAANAASAPTEEWWNMFFTPSIFHNRIGAKQGGDIFSSPSMAGPITKDDFMHFPWSKGLIYDKGSTCRYGNSAPMDMTDVSGITAVQNMASKNEKYLRLFIEECAKKHIPLLLFRASAWSRTYAMPYCNYVAKLANEYHVMFINTMLLTGEIGFASSDSYDGGHLNTVGARKMTHYIGGVLRDMYGLPDRRGDERYESWEVNARNMRASYIDMVKGTQYYEDEIRRARAAGDKAYQ